MKVDDRKHLITRYAGGFEEVSRAIEGLSDEDLSAHPLAGKWSAREIVQHLADSETISGQRLRRLLVEVHPVLLGYDQDAFAVRLRYNERPIGPALDAFRAARATTLQVLEHMTESDWTREGWHSESGRYTAETWLGIYADHAHLHAGQIRRLREAMGR